MLLKGEMSFPLTFQTTICTLKLNYLAVYLKKLLNSAPAEVAA